jgi:predicted metal-dependent hydrolase
MPKSRAKPQISEFEVSGINIQVIRKDIKNLHLGVHPPEGHVRVATPLHVTDGRVRLAVIDKLSWIKKQQAEFREQPRQSEREMVNGECHYLWGRQYRLEIVVRPGKTRVEIGGGGRILLTVGPNASLDIRQRALTEWYRQQLKSCLPKLVAKWQKKISVTPNDWGVKKMKTKWGSCNIEAKRIWLNLELAKKPPECLEYIIVHELVHLLERNHNERFKGYMDQFMPNWRLHREVLNTSPLAFEKWVY